MHAIVGNGWERTIGDNPKAAFCFASCDGHSDGRVSPRRGARNALGAREIPAKTNDDPHSLSPLAKVEAALPSLNVGSI
jgi:hypothetical protein